ncbi:unnamed protein product [Caenorhabditis angaria]|uniref:C-type lectin domain-containing protein n=1 Tax=Caenorhabditis angaria TaxID=860376 RepID=A0A9P1MU98_9PELO|nr:unnamed protein product [Caenorhabditis angaria]
MLLKVLSLFLCLQLVDSCRLRCRNRTQCDDGWTYYKRNTTGWCMKMMRAESEDLNKTSAENVCKASGAVLSSIDNMDMFNVVLGLREGPFDGFFWIGAELKADCECGNMKCIWKPECELVGYIWTDGFSLTTPINSLDSIEEINTEIENGYIYVASYIVVFWNGSVRTMASFMMTNRMLCGKQSNY